MMEEEGIPYVVELGVAKLAVKKQREESNDEAHSF